MIGWLSGRVVAVVGERLILGVQGVGYEVACTHGLLAAATARPEQPMTLWVHTHVAEDRLDLFGFEDGPTRDAFRVLIGISGIGPKVALAVLSGLPLAELERAIAFQDAAALQRVPGVGKKIAQRLVTELAERGLGRTATVPLGAPAEVAAPGGALRTDALMALKALGFPPRPCAEAVEALLAGAEPPTTVEDLVARALPRLTARPPG